MKEKNFFEMVGPTFVSEAALLVAESRDYVRVSCPQRHAQRRTLLAVAGIHLEDIETNKNYRQTFIQKKLYIQTKNV